MASAVKNYLVTLVERFGAGWNRFWYVPSDPYVLGVSGGAAVGGILVMSLGAGFGLGQSAVPPGAFAGAVITTVESAVFELLREAGTDTFKKVLPLFR